VVITGRDPARCAQAQSHLSHLGRVHAVSAHAGDPTSATDLVENAVGWMGGIDHVINNAGISLGGYPADLDDAVMLKSYEVNTLGAVRLIRAALPFLEAAKGASIVNVLTAGLWHTGAGLAPYHTSKGALAALTRQLAYDLAPKDIRVNGLAPGVVATEMTGNARGGLIGEAVSRTPMQRTASVDELCGPVIYLLSNASSFMTGQLMVVDGGLTL
jgi:NAD(P)-dependent dehydrogenase (short-subunit alcohol dehydrogenase family)